MMPPAEYAAFDALGLAELVRRRDVTASELLETALAQIERIDPRINAVIDRLDHRARATVARGLPAGPFAGVPFLLKDAIAYQGERLTLGSRSMADYIPETSHEVVRRLEGAGLVIVGRTNICEYGLLPLTEPELYGPTRNPWALDRSPGGSSGGSAAAVAAGLVPLAHGNDGGGSIRIPASACGLFGLKPSRGRNPGALLDEPHGLIAEHCLARSARDSAALLDVTRGALPGDRWQAPPPVRPYLEQVTIDPPRLRIAFRCGPALRRAGPRRGAGRSGDRRRGL
jgi:amidase